MTGQESLFRYKLILFAFLVFRSAFLEGAESSSRMQDIHIHQCYQDRCIHVKAAKGFFSLAGDSLLASDALIETTSFRSQTGKLGRVVKSGEKILSASTHCQFFHFDIRSQFLICDNKNVVQNESSPAGPGSYTMDYHLIANPF